MELVFRELYRVAYAKPGPAENLNQRVPPGIDRFFQYRVDFFNTEG